MIGSNNAALKFEQRLSSASELAAYLGSSTYSNDFSLELITLQLQSQYSNNNHLFKAVLTSLYNVESDWIDLAREEQLYLVVMPCNLDVSFAQTYELLFRKSAFLEYTARQIAG